MLCRLLAALVCVLCARELFAPSVLALDARSQSELHADSPSDDARGPAQEPLSREQRDEREQDERELDDEDDDFDDSREAARFTIAFGVLPCELAIFRHGRCHEAPRHSHLSLDPRPPRRA